VYLVAIYGLLAYGLFRFATGTLPEYAPPPEWVKSEHGIEALGLFLLLRAFSSGSVALTGTEAVSNGVPAFKPPESRMSPKEEAAALEVLVREPGWSTRQVGEAIKRSHIYVSRRLRVFDDPVRAPLVLNNELPVSTADELLREPDPGTRRELVGQGVEERWQRPPGTGCPRRAERCVPAAILTPGQPHPGTG
jgi:hypothetical protein